MKTINEGADAFNIRNFLQRCPNYISIDIETTGLDMDADIYTASMAWCYEDETEISKMSFYLNKYCKTIQKHEETFKQILTATIFNPAYQGAVIFHNAAFDLPYLLKRFYEITTGVFAQPENYRFGLKDFSKIYDTQALSRSLRNNKYISHSDPYAERCHSLKFLAREYLGIEHRSFKDTIGIGNIRLADPNVVLEYNQKDSEITLRLFLELRRSSHKNIKEWQYFEHIEMPFIIAIIGLNWRGIPFNFERAKTLANLIKTEMFRLESEIYRDVGWSFNLHSARDLAHALFGNANLTYLDRSYERRLSPLYESELGQRKVDIATLVKLRMRTSHESAAANKASRILNMTIQYLEISQAYEDVEKLQRHAVRTPTNAHRIFSKITADAKTGRIKCGSPNVLGISKQIFADSNISATEVGLLAIKEFKSVRSLISVDAPDKEEIVSIDISGLDLGVITAGLLAHDPSTYWRQCFERFGQNGKLTLDTHLAILRRVSPGDYQTALQAFSKHLNIPTGQEKRILEYWVTKEQKADSSGQEEIKFIHGKTNEVISLPIITISESEKRAKKLLRDAMKTTNLAIPYNQGAAKLALALTEATGRKVGEIEARERLERYHLIFPEIRALQDSIANAVYHDGFLQTPFGRTIFADVFDEMNMHLKLNQSKGVSDIYEFITFIHGKYWYVKAEKWLKTSESIIKNLRMKAGANVLVFDKIVSFYQVDRKIFRKKARAGNSQFLKKTEANVHEQNIFISNMFAITHEVDQAIRFGQAWESEAEIIRSSWCENGNYQIPESAVLFYRTDLPNPSSKFFRTYKSLIKVARPFFATYCQSEATIVAKICLNKIQEELETRSTSADLIFFIHDQFDVISPKQERECIKSILNRAIEYPKSAIFPEAYEYPIRFFGEFEIKGEFFK